MLKSIEDVRESLLDSLISLAESNGCKFKAEHWKSKCNAYVNYDYKPFCSEGFAITLDFECSSENHFKFVKYLYNKMISDMDLLDETLELNCNDDM